jgi:hypothetical protein
MSEQVIVQAIEASEPRFDTSPDSLIQLKKMGATDEVIKAIIASSSRKTIKANATQTPNKQCANEAGTGSIFVHDGRHKKILASERGDISVASSVLSMFGSALTFGIIPITGGATVTFEGSKAKVAIESRKPSFSEIGVPPESNYEEQFGIIRLERTSSDTREFKVIESKSGLFGSGAQQVGQKNILPVNIRPEGPNCLSRGKVRTRLIIEAISPLDPGEYAFVGGKTFFPFSVE